MSTLDKLQEIDRRALALDCTLSALADKAGVSSATIARWRKGESVRLRSVSKLEAALDQMEVNRG